MLPISRLGSALNIQKALSIATSNIVTKQSIIHPAVAIASGFDSFEQALALTERSELIEHSLWAEQSFNINLWRIHCGSVSFELDTHTGNLNTIDFFGEHIESVALPELLLGYTISEDEFEYCHKMKKIVIRTHVGYTFVFHRSSEQNISYLVIDNKEHDPDLPAKSYTLYSDSMLRSSVWNDADTQLPRLLDEISAVCEADLDSLATEYGLTGQDVKDTLDTATWIFEKNKGHNQFADELKPKRTLAAPMGLIAHLLLTKYFHFNSAETVDILESMTLEHDALDLLRGMARAEAKRFIFTHYKK